jgi:hypothetical protein
MGNNRVLRCELRRSVLKYVEMRHATSSEHANDATGEIEEFVCRVHGDIGSLRSNMVDVVQTVFCSPPTWDA